jgi:hypothetical protein
VRDGKADERSRLCDQGTHAGSAAMGYFSRSGSKAAAQPMRTGGCVREQVRAVLAARGRGQSRGSPQALAGAVWPLLDGLMVRGASVGMWCGTLVLLGTSRVEKVQKASLAEHIGRINFQLFQKASLAEHTVLASRLRGT